LSKARKKTVSRKKTPYDARQLRLAVPTEHERKLAARAKAAGFVEEEDFPEEEPDGAGELVRPLRHRVYNAIIGLCLVPFAWVLTVALLHTFGAMGRNGMIEPFYKTHEFVSLIAGCGTWLFIFFASLAIRGTPLLVHTYVLGHEFMHAWIAGLFFKGKIREFEVSSDGGHIVTDKYNFIIALAPYLWPIYCIPVLAAWGVAGWTPLGLEYAGTFFGALGFAWMFHVSFTVWMLMKGQSDLLLPGRIFSLVLIYTINVGLLAAFVITMAPEFTWSGFMSELWKVTKGFYVSIGSWF
jgi:hypothetical protein